MKRSADAPIQSPAKSLRLDAETIEDIRKIERRTGLNGESFAIATKQMSAIQSVNEQHIYRFIYFQFNSSRVDPMARRRILFRSSITHRTSNASPSLLHHQFA